VKQRMLFAAVVAVSVAAAMVLGGGPWPPFI
jgi:hypothetical protein